MTLINQRRMTLTDFLGYRLNIVYIQLSKTKHVPLEPTQPAERNINTVNAVTTQ